MALGGFFRKSFLVFAVLAAARSFAVSVEKVDFADQLDVGGKKLVLNGAGLRVKRKFGMNFNVYVAGLYVTKKSSDAKVLLASDDPKYVRMVFLRSLSKDTLQDAMEESFKKNCRFDCGAQAPKLKSFTDLMVGVREGDELKIGAEKETATIDIKGKETKSGKIEGSAFSKNLLAMFIGEEPPTEDLKRALLGK